jgi:hypothetical protein
MKMIFSKKESVFTMSQYFENGSTHCHFDTHYCSACVYWGGRRNIFGDLIEFDTNDKGRCNNIQSPAYGQDIPSMHSCGCKKDF